MRSKWKIKEEKLSVSNAFIHSSQEEIEPISLPKVCTFPFFPFLILHSELVMSSYL